MVLTRSKQMVFGQVLAIWLLSNGCSKTPLQKEVAFLQKGKKLAEKHDYQRAILEFKNAAQAMPKDAEPYYQTALVYVALEDRKTAYSALKKAESLSPKHPGVQVAIAKLELWKTNRAMVEDAEKRMQEVLKGYSLPDASVTLAVAETLLGNYDGAIRTLQQALAANPDHVKAARSLSSLEMSRNDPVGAETTLKKLAQAAPGSSDAGLALAEFYIKSGKNREAEAEIRRTIQLNLKNPRPLILLAALQTAQGQKDQAENTYRQISDFPDKALKSLHARFLLQEGKQEEAVKELEQLVKETPEDREVRGLLVSAEFSLGRRKPAKEILDKALRNNPRDTEALLQRSQFFLADGKLEETTADLRSVLRANPNSVEAHYALARVAGLQGSALVQRQELAETLRLNPKALEARIYFAKLLLLKSPKAASDLLEEAPKSQKRLPEYLAAKNWALLALKNEAETRTGLATALAVARSPEILYQCADFKFSEKDYAGARTLLEEALNKGAENMPALNLLARTYAAQGQLNKAVEVVEAHVKLKPSSPYLLSMLGIWQSRAQHIEQARQAFVQATVADAGYLPARLALAHLDASRGNLAEARSSLEFILSKEPRNVQGLLGLGMVEEKLKDPISARMHFVAALEAEPGNLEALRDLANNLVADKPDEAMKYAESAVELAPDDAAAQDALGWVYYRKGLYSNALPYFKSAVANRPTAIRRYHLALAYARVGQRQLADQNMTAALQLDPTLKVTEALAR